MQINPSPLEGGLRGVFHLNGDAPSLRESVRDLLSGRRFLSTTKPYNGLFQ